MFKIRKHRHDHKVIFTKDKGRIQFMECRCGHRKTKASADARNVKIPYGWPKPRGRKRNRSAPGSTPVYGS